jgi:Skp family chaperone for outer membrane proteins
MSDAAGGPTVDWVVSAGSILGIVATFTVVGAAVWKIIQVIRNKVTGQVIQNRDEAREMFAKIEKQIEHNQTALGELIDSKVEGGRQRYDDMKYWVEKIQAQVEQNRQEVDRNRQEIYKRIEQGDAANQKILDKINDLSTDVARIKGLIQLANGAVQKRENDNK